MTQLTQRQKIEGYAALETRATKSELAVHDLVNHRFSLAKKFSAPRIREEIDAQWDGGAYTVAMSWRAMPLFLVRYLAGAQDVQSQVLTDDEIQNAYRMNPTGRWERIVMTARNELVQDAIRKEIAASMARQQRTTEQETAEGK